MAGIYVPWLSDAARLTGYPVVEVAGWRTRGHGGLAAVEGVVAHHTAGPRAGEMPSLGVVRDGRAGLAGPLSQFGLGRSGTIYVIAAGVAYHAGVSAWSGMTSLNSRFLGIEAESAGTGDFTAEQSDCYPRLVAACLYYMRRDASRAAGHREVALPLGRKVDPTGIDMPAFRRRVADLLVDPLARIPRGNAAPSSPTGDQDMTPEQAQQLALLASQLVTGQDPAKAWGWPTFAGGTGETLTVVDYLRRLNVQVQQLHDRLSAIETGKAATSGGPTAEQIAAATVALLGRKTSS